IFWILALLLSTQVLSAQLFREEVKVLLDRQQTYGVRVADMNGDGALDVVSSHRGYNGQFRIYFREEGLGNFSTPYYFGDTTWWNFPDRHYKFGLGDMDGDGDVDLVPGQLAAATVPYFRNDGSGQFTPSPVSATSSTDVSDNNFFRIADLNNDGAQEVVIFRRGLKRLYANLNDGTGTAFEEQLLHETDIELGGHFVQDFFVLDLDNDGDLDYGVVVRETDFIGSDPIKRLHLHLFEQTCTLCFEPLLNTVLVESERSVSYERGIWASLTTDAAPSFLYRYGYEDEENQQRDQLQLWTFDWSAGTATQQYTLEAVSGFTAQDLDADGDVDFLLGHDAQYVPSTQHEYTLHWLENMNSTAWELRSLPYADNQFSEFYSHDFDQDGQQDILMKSGLISEAIGIRYQTDPLAWTTIFPVDRPINQSIAKATEDWDQDGDMDVLFFAEQSGRIVSKNGLYRISQQADGSFSEAEQVFSSYTTSGQYQTLVDFNGDGRLDALGIEGRYGTVDNRFLALTLQQADGSFPPADTIPLLENFYLDVYAVGQWSGDALPDIMALATNGDLVLYTNEMQSGNGFSAQAQTWGMTNYNNGHQKLDAANFYSTTNSDVLLLDDRKIFVARGLGNGEFVPWDTLPMPENFDVLEAFSHDFTGDGLDDILVLGRNDNWQYMHGLSSLTPGDTVLSPLQLVDPQAGGNSLYYSFADFDADGRMDYVSSEGFRLNQNDGQYFTSGFKPAPFDEEDWLASAFSVQAIPVQLDADAPPEMISGWYELMQYDVDFLQRSRLAGRLLWDTTATCTIDSLLPPLSDWRVAITGGGQDQLATSQTEGNYGALLPAADVYELRPLPPSGYWQACPVDTALVVDNDTTNYAVDFAVEALVDCPLIAIDLTTTTISQCFSTGVAVSYYNAGTAPAEEVVITLTHDPRFTILSSTTPWEMATDSTLTFQFTDVGVGERAYVYLTFDPDCESLEVGEIVCFVAMVTPNELCEDMLLQWDGSNLVAEVLCEADQLAYRIVNTGTGATAQPVNYRLSIVNDDIILYLNDNVILEPGQADTILLPDNEQLWHLRLDQTPGHPFPAPLSLTTEGCGVTDSLLAVGVLPNEDGDPFREEVCRDVIGPYDPNDKTALPVGYGAVHYIQRDWTLDYTIQFQNVGSDRARTVILEDQLSNLLDWTSLRPTAASHGYEWMVQDNGLLRVTFPEINLADSTSNEAASKGFFSFEIRPRSDAPFETDIDNFADIFFDFNAPIRTSTVRHRIRKP
ncbi:MAG: VCBS repeat-containing protein, partial [Bacteroidota bacterium]